MRKYVKCHVKKKKPLELVFNLPDKRLITTLDLGDRTYISYNEFWTLIYRQLGLEFKRIPGDGDVMGYDLNLPPFKNWGEG